MRKNVLIALTINLFLMEPSVFLVPKTTYIVKFINYVNNAQMDELPIQYQKNVNVHQPLHFGMVLTVFLVIIQNILT